ncbi:hypothetical protein NL676_018295 [Syzygium grande]|nr:hypothetical protein NL676_018295 [Syzygium grande]
MPGNATNSLRKLTAPTRLGKQPTSPDASKQSTTLSLDDGPVGLAEPSRRYTRRIWHSSVHHRRSSNYISKSCATSSRAQASLLQCWQSLSESRHSPIVLCYGCFNLSL